MTKWPWRSWVTSASSAQASGRAPWDHHLDGDRVARRRPAGDADADGVHDGGVHEVARAVPHRLDLQRLALVVAGQAVPVAVRARRVRVGGRGSAAGAERDRQRGEQERAARHEGSSEAASFGVRSSGGGVTASGWVGAWAGAGGRRRLAFEERSRRALVGDGLHRRVAPQPLEVVVGPELAVEHVDGEVEVVEHDPAAGAGLALLGEGPLAGLVADGVHDAVHDGADLEVGLAGGEHEVVHLARDAAQVHHRHVERALVEGGVDGDAGQLAAGRGAGAAGAGRR